MVRRLSSLVLVGAIACGSSARPSAPAAPPAPPDAVAELSPALAPLAWWLGDWAGDHGSEHWVAAGGALFGVALGADGGYEVMIVDDADGPGPADGVLRFFAMPGGASQDIFAGAEVGVDRVTFRRDGDDFPTAITYRKDGIDLIAELTGDDRARRFGFRPMTPTPAPALAAADRAFSDATAAGGVAAWSAAFDPAGAMLDDGRRVEGPDAVGELMRGVLEAGTLRWAPLASGQRGEVGYTVGTAQFTPRAGGAGWRSAYVTIWRRQPDGGWKVWFDTGRPINE